MDTVIKVSHLNKIYDGGFQALKDVNLEIRRGEIFALLGPNGAGKTTLISIICGINNLSSGSVVVAGYDIIKDYRQTRSLIGLVPQELATDAFESVWNTVNFSRGLFGKTTNRDFVEKILVDLSLWDKRHNRLMTLSGGMKRRVMIAKALVHEPQILFLDEPTAGVDVELRKNMWKLVHELRSAGVTIILTTHYIEEAEEMADRVGVINHGELILVEEKDRLVKKMGIRQMTIDLVNPVRAIPAELSSYDLKLSENQLIYTYDSKREEANGIGDFFEALRATGLRFNNIVTRQSSLEEIFVELVNKK